MHLQGLGLAANAPKSNWMEENVQNRSYRANISKINTAQKTKNGQKKSVALQSVTNLVLEKPRLKQMDEKWKRFLFSAKNDKRIFLEDVDGQGVNPQWRSSSSRLSLAPSLSLLPQLSFLSFWL